MKILCFIISLLLINEEGFSQSAPYTDAALNPNIKSVEFYNTKKQGSFPIIKLGSDEHLQLAFDDLRGAVHDFYYTVEHCDGDWNSSNLINTDYLQGLNEDKITDYAYSTTTLQKYTHYTLKFPNDNMKPRIAGDYILKVYEDDDPNKVILTRRLYILGSKVSISADIVPSPNVSTRQTNQKVDFQVNYGSLSVQNPNRDLRVWVMQNDRNETGRFTTEVQYIRGNQLIYGDMNTNDFSAGNEFRHFDTRSLKLNSDRVSKIYMDTANTVVLLTDQNRNEQNYIFQYDNDGKFYILNQEGSNPANDADYAHIYFSLNANKTGDQGSAYIVGKFNDYKLDDNSKLDYDTRGKFYKHLFLKQGVYDYQYVWVDNASQNQDNVALEGSFYETENTYQILVYYRAPTARWEELVGYSVLSTTNKR